MTQIKMLSTHDGSVDGHTLQPYQEGQVYDLRGPGGEDLARSFIQAGWAELVEGSAAATTGPAHSMEQAFDLLQAAHERQILRANGLEELLQAAQGENAVMAARIQELEDRLQAAQAPGPQQNAAATPPQAPTAAEKPHKPPAGGKR